MPKFLWPAVLAALLAAAPALADDLSIQIDTTKQGPKINPRMYGIFLEEINHGVDGGLYAEMIQNRGFEDAKAPEGFTYIPGNGAQGGGRGGRGGRGGGNRTIDATGGRWVNASGIYATIFPWKPDASLPYWSLVENNGAGSATLDMADPLNPNTPRSCKLVISSINPGGRVGISNEGFCAKPNSSAIGIKQGEQYELTFFARAEGFTGNLAASVEAAGPEGPAETNTATISGLTPQWKQYKATLTATKTDGTGKFVLAADAKGTIWFDMVSLFPAKTFKDRPNGLRQDIAQMIADLKPGFVRFPGGCVVESSTVETAYNWKNTLGPVEQRPEMWNAWDYRRTHGMGIYEYLQFIEDIGATPMYVGFAGQTCIYRNAAVVPMDQMQPIVQGYSDLVEYADGPATSQWGKLRADSGHPAPFGLKMMEIGNENNDPGGRGQPVYTPRYNMIFQDLKAKHPEIQTIADLPLRGSTVEMVDEHHYADPNWFINAAHLYDNANRNTPLYLGEVAVTSGQNVPPERGNLLAALAEGTYLMGAERNSDVVKMVSYAPLLANVDGRTDLPTAPPPYWHGMIYFDSTRTFGTASYYLWKTFGANVPSVNLPTRVSAGDTIDGIVGNVGIGTWGTQAEFKDVKVQSKDGKTLYASDFTKGTDGWTRGAGAEAGRWQVVNDAYRQTANQSPCVAYVGDESWTDYTLTLKAQKLGGAEGFLIIFGHHGNDRYWWNIGGYGNTRHEIEMNQAVQGRVANGAIENNRWYDLKIEVTGRHVRAYMDGQLVNDVQVALPEGPVSAIAGRDEATGEFIIKAINRSGNLQNASINLAGLAGHELNGKITLLTAPINTANNSLDNPNRVIPTEKDFHANGPKFNQDLPPYSLTVLRLKPTT